MVRYLSSSKKYVAEADVNRLLVCEYAKLCRQLAVAVGPKSDPGIHLREFATIVLNEKSLRYTFDRDKGEWYKQIKTAIDLIKKQYTRNRAFWENLPHEEDSVTFQTTILERAKLRARLAVRAEGTLDAIRSDMKEILGARN